MTPHAGADRWQSGVEGFIGGEVAVEAVHLQRVHVNGVAEVDRLYRAVPLRRGGAAVCREHGGERRDTYEPRHCKPSASQVHPRVSCKGELINRVCEEFHKRSTGGKMSGPVVRRKMVGAARTGNWTTDRVPFTSPRSGDVELAAS